ncbi:MAG: protein translocase subunit SecF [Acidobacteria bacterium]|nr:protein translocase subunit SecF [Acidobacteriota bacterium]MBI3279929.1 protein translocase subunit SecF [Acidobacteriota bacterium]
MELFKNTNFDFLGRKWPFIILSVLLTAAGLASLVMKGGPRYGIDFKGGALVYVRFAQTPPIDHLRSALSARLPGGTAEIQEVVGINEVIIGTEVQDERTLARVRDIIQSTLAATFSSQAGGKLDINNTTLQAAVERLRDPLQRAGVALSEPQLQDLVRAIFDYKNTPPRSGIIRGFDELSGVPGVTPQVRSVLKQEFTAAPYAIRGAETVGPKVGGELRNQAILATLYALGGMLVYIAFRFEWIYGVAAVLAVFHDVIITIGLFSIFNYEISLTVVAALLTLVGYSMNDTIVVFDRIRENLKLMRREAFSSIVNISINQTLSRTVLTSGLTLLTALALFFLGGPVLHGFAFALVAGIIVGTYSSVFIASPILVFWQDFAEKRKRRTAAPAPAGGAMRRAPAKSVK